MFAYKYLYSAGANLHALVNNNMLTDKVTAVTNYTAYIYLFGCRILHKYVEIHSFIY